MFVARELQFKAQNFKVWLYVLAATSMAASAQPQEQPRIRACYFTNWSQYRPGRGKFVPENYTPGLCTHILYAFGTMNEDFTLKASDWADVTTPWQKGLYERVNDLKKTDLHLKTLLSIGGWNFGTKLFKAMAATASTRKTFIDSAVGFLREHSFDGLDIDWEYPQGFDDTINIVSLMKEVRQAFEAEGIRTGKSRLLISAAVSAGEATISQGYNIPELAQSLDFVLVMTYDFHGGWEQKTGLNSPLYDSAQPNWNVDAGARIWAERGMPRNKIVIGIPTYGRGWTLQNTASTSIGAATTGVANPTEFIREAGVASYYELCQMLSTGATRVWVAESQTPYLVKGNQWFGYDDEESVRNKMKWLKQNNYGGAFVWTLDMDDFSGQCPNGGGRKYPVISIIQEELGGGIAPVTAPFTAPFTAPVTAPVTAPSINTSPHPLTWTFVPVTWGTVPIQSFTTPPVPETTTSANGAATTAFRCPGDGFFADPTSCSHFYRCAWGIAYHFACPDTLQFDITFNVCMGKGGVNCIGSA